MMESDGISSSIPPNEEVTACKENEIQKKLPWVQEFWDKHFIYHNVKNNIVRKNTVRRMYEKKCEQDQKLTRAEFNQLSERIGVKSKGIRCQIFFFAKFKQTSHTSTDGDCGNEKMLEEGNSLPLFKDKDPCLSESLPTTTNCNIIVSNEINSNNNNDKNSNSNKDSDSNNINNNNIHQAETYSCNQNAASQPASLRMRMRNLDRFWQDHYEHNDGLSEGVKATDVYDFLLTSSAYYNGQTYDQLVDFLEVNNVSKGTSGAEGILVLKVVPSSLECRHFHQGKMVGLETLEEHSRVSSDEGEVSSKSYVMKKRKRKRKKKKKHDSFDSNTWNSFSNQYNNYDISSNSDTGSFSDESSIENDNSNNNNKIDINNNSTSNNENNSSHISESIIHSGYSGTSLKRVLAV